MMTHDSPSVRRAATTHNFARGKRILIVDDNADAAYSIAKLLELLGHEVVVALDGASALTIAAQRAPEVILLDIGMPGMDGYEVARRLREAGSDAVIIAVTGYSQADDRWRSHHAGFDRHLLKPVDIHYLQEVILEVLKH